MHMAPRWAAVWLAVWCALLVNQTLWRRLGKLPDFADAWGVQRVGFGLFIAAATYLWLMLWSWPGVRRWVWGLTIVIAALAQYYMLHYGVVMDMGMIRNVLATNPSEGLALLTPSMALHLLLYAGIPLLWLFACVRWPRVPVRQTWWRNAVAVLGAVALLAGSVLVQFKELAPLMRNHKELRYMVNPMAAIVSTLQVALDPILNKKLPFVDISAGAALGPTYTAASTQAKPPLLVLVVGETARADRFSLNGYARPTNPELQARGVISWKRAYSCGTNTLASVPCMFSSLGKSEYEGRNADYGSLMDVLQAAGLGVDWVDNQSGCKEVCDRIPNTYASAVATPEAVQQWCASDGECLDQLMLGVLDARMAAMPPAARDKGVVLALHQMGSHGPAYYKRSSPENKKFLPECTTNVTSKCAQADLDNVYDNSMVETDQFLAKLIDWLQTKQADYAPALLYVSDHGESLGENGLYLHGLPYAVAPDVQKHVPWVLWPGALPARTHTDEACLRGTVNKVYTHDNYFHTVLGLLDVQSPTYKVGLDMMAPCRPRR